MEIFTRVLRTWRQEVGRVRDPLGVNGRLIGAIRCSSAGGGSADRPKPKSTGPLAGLRVLDMTRVLAGPCATQMLGDLGADVLKVERREVGDDTRYFAPPFLPKNKAMEPSDTSAFFAGVNRNKRSMTLDYTTKDGQDVVRRLVSRCDIFVENFKTGTLDKYGLGFKDLQHEFPGLIYCSVTGFGHTGPYKDRPGYDLLVQAMGGIMSITGEEAGEPMKVGISVCDLAAGLHGVIGILAALRHKSLTGKGQHVDIGMLDVTVSMLANQGMNYLSTGKVPPRRGNNHPNVVPYQVMRASDGHFILSVANDATFARFCGVAGREDLLDDERCATAVARVTHRAHVTEVCNDITRTRSASWWLEHLSAAKVGCSPILNLKEVFDDPQVRARGMVKEFDHPSCEEPAQVIANPLRLSQTPASYRTRPPLLGEHTDEILEDIAGFSPDEVAAFRRKGVV